MSESLVRLRKLTEELPTLLDFVERENGNFIQYSPASDGTFLGFGLYKEKDVAVQKVFMSKGTEIAEHKHTETECGIIYKGKAKINYNGKESKLLEKGDSVIFKPNEPHSGIILEDTWMIFITVPAEEGYPDDRK